MQKERRFYIRLFIILVLIINVTTLSLVAITLSEVLDLAFLFNTEHSIETFDNIDVIEPPIPAGPPKNILIEVEEKTELIFETEKDEIVHLVNKVADQYDNVSAELIQSIIYHESRFNSKAVNGNCVGLMQISTRWHADRAEELGVTDLYDPYSNILLGTDYISELINRYEDPALALMMYNMKHDTAMKLYNEGTISNYAKAVLTRADEIHSEGS